jgi:hypothetical protein
MVTGIRLPAGGSRVVRHRLRNESRRRLSRKWAAGLRVPLLQDRAADGFMVSVGQWTTPTTTHYYDCWHSHSAASVAPR